MRQVLRQVGSFRHNQLSCLQEKRDQKMIKQVQCKPWQLRLPEAE